MSSAAPSVPVAPPAVATKSKKVQAKKKPATSVAKKTSSAPKKTPAHPKFIDMIVEAIKSLNERSGSSKQALAKFIFSKYPVDDKSAQKYIKTSLKNGLKSGQIKQASGVGLSGSFKVGEKAVKKVKAAKKVAKPAADKVAKKPKVAKKSPAKAKKPASAKPKVLNQHINNLFTQKNIHKNFFSLHLIFFHSVSLKFKYIFFSNLKGNQSCKSQASRSSCIASASSSSSQKESCCQETGHQNCDEKDSDCQDQQKVRQDAS